MGRKYLNINQSILRESVDACVGEHMVWYRLDEPTKKFIMQNIRNFGSTVKDYYRFQVEMILNDYPPVDRRTFDKYRDTAIAIYQGRSYKGDIRI